MWGKASASWFETRFALLTMRVQFCSNFALMPLNSAAQRDQPTLIDYEKRGRNSQTHAVQHVALPHAEWAIRSLARFSKLI
ncbi:hypothetical protein [Bradyrhizobium prioriisuperbiae]|uniref:hypothetical protein n=1 Tax=Bradyrhizobium prioriisuperbiae TaxID=2854389 RepID=UPI0028EC98E6|nr:hypothetical protein [Bradyrhizobium prioritasuperba]